MSGILSKSGIQSQTDASEKVELMVRLYKQSVFAVCLANTRNVHDAEDMTQEVFLRAFRKVNSLRNGDRARAWLIRIARNACISHYRKKRPSPSAALDETSAPSASNPLVGRLHDALSRLPEEYRETISLYYLDGRKCATVASCLDITGPSRSRTPRHSGNATRTG
jgi:RNA polymerase sigma-70 factor (ECF subfamily)